MTTTTAYIFGVICIILVLQAVDPVESILIVNTGVDQITYRAPYIFFGAHPFNLTAELVLAIDYDSCNELQSNLDLADKIVVSGAPSECPPSETESGLGIRATNVLHTNARAVVFIIRDNDVERSFRSASAGFLMLDLPILILSLEDGNHLINVTQRTNTTLLATIISDEIPILDTGRSGIHTFLIALSLVVDLLGTFWTGYQLRLYFNSPSTAAISRIALVLLLLGCIASTIERVLTILFLWLVMFDVNLLTAIFVIGAFFVVFAATFIALYWSTLVFPMKKRELESYKLFIPLLVFFSANAIVYMVMLGLGLNNSTVVLDAIFAVVLGLLALYFIISGAVLIRTMTNYFKAAHSKGKAKRFQAALVLTGISLVLLLVSVALAVLDLYYTNQLYYWIIRTLINLLSVLSAAALAMLFKDPSSEQTSTVGDTATQPTTLSTSTSPRSGENIELVTTN